ncbi:MAG: preprotein translocase subunit YajC [Leptospiraceae bacterium]|nr:preprotein translocase subunit YajC [Leptospiraceae bacterium]MCP5502824.1 preprotein translocase subunit YajC [Leptospiraceae bacterium]
MYLAFQFAILLAEQAQKGQGGSIFSSLVIIPIMMVFMYFLVILPNRKEEKKKKEMIDSLAKGDQVVTMSGIHGKVVEFRDNNESIVLNIAKDTNVVFSTSSIVKKKQ